MSKAEVLENLGQITSELKKSKTKLNQITNTSISKKEHKELIQKIAVVWFEKIEMQLTPLKIDEKIIEKYHKYFEKLLKLSLTNSRKTSYITNIDSILEKFNEDLIVIVMKSSIQIEEFKSLEKILTSVTEKEKEYLMEAIGCANNSFLRGSVVLGWSAAIHRIHKTVESLGLDIFNSKSQEMKDIDAGRYKRFTKVFTIQNFSDLQKTVFDNDLLWIIEYWGLIDSNQHDRLSACFVMRNNSGHPGEANISPANLISFYSDLENIIFKNSNFPLIE